MLPAAFDNYFKRPSHSYATRYVTQKNFEKTRPQNAKEKYQLKHIGPNKWSGIGLEIKQAPTLKAFINLFRTHLIDTRD